MTFPAEIYVHKARTEPYFQPARWSDQETPGSTLYVRGDLIQEFLQNLVADAVLREIIPGLVQQVLDTFPQTVDGMTFHSGGVVTLEPPVVETLPREAPPGSVVLMNQVEPDE